MADNSRPYVNVSIHQNGLKHGDHGPSVPEAQQLVTQFEQCVRLRKDRETATWYADYFNGTSEQTAEVKTRKLTDVGYSLYYEPPFRAVALAINDATSTGEIVFITIPARDHFPVRMGFGIDRPFWITKVWLEEGKVNDDQTSATDILIWG